MRVVSVINFVLSIKLINILLLFYLNFLGILFISVILQEDSQLRVHISILL